LLGTCFLKVGLATANIWFNQTPCGAHIVCLLYLTSVGPLKFILVASKPAYSALAPKLA
jgi:hypothetical protein